MTQPAMTAKEITKVVALAADGDKFMTADKMTEGRIQLWMYAILTEAPEMTLEQAQQAIGHYYARLGDSMQIGDLIQTWETLAGKAQAPHLLARDVRVARSIGLVDRDWDEKKRLPLEVVDKLTQWRKKQAEERAQLEQEITAATDGKQLRLSVGKAV